MAQGDRVAGGLFIEHCSFHPQGALACEVSVSRKRVSGVYEEHAMLGRSTWSFDIGLDQMRHARCSDTRR
nr:hypothetical protein CFP56_08993 [Quercus suber]